MKYTVVLDQSVPDELRDELSQRLSTRFGLGAEQARKLAGRKPGRLLKPTSKSRAETLLALYQAMGLGVSLEGVPDEEGAPSVGAASFGGAAVAAPGVAPSPVVPSPVVASAAPGAGAKSLGAVLGSLPGEPVSPPAPAPTSVQPEVIPTEPLAAERAIPVSERTFAEDPISESAEPRPERRLSLRRRVVVTTVLPLLLTALALAGVSVLSTQQFQQNLTRDNARALAASVGSSINVEDTPALDAQLRSLLGQPNVGFISVNTPEGLQFFRSKNADADPILGPVVSKYVAGHPGAGSLKYSDKPADRLAVQLKQLKDSGMDLGSSQAALEAKIKAPESQKVTTNYFEIQQVNVYARKDDQGVPRKVAVGVTDGASGAQKGQKPLYTVAVGVLANASVNYLRQSLLTNVLLAILFTGVAALIAIGTSRRIVRPIERLVLAADAISLGQLDTPVVAERNDEIGDLAKALERMRLSLEAAMERLRKRRNR